MCMQTLCGDLRKWKATYSWLARVLALVITVLRTSIYVVRARLARLQTGPAN